MVVFPVPWGAVEDYRGRPGTFDQAPQRFSLSEQVPLTGYLIEIARAHAGGKRGGRSSVEKPRTSRTHPVTAGEWLNLSPFVPTKQP